MNQTEQALTPQKCALCGNQGKLCKSHIIPKFAGKWLKTTSATGFLRLATDPDNRIQDLPTAPLLCTNCEQLFSKSELYFASKIFYPFLEEGKRDIANDENLLYFIISLSWRTLKTSYSEQSSQHPWIKPHLDEAEEVWRHYLLGESKNFGMYEHYLFFLDYLKEGSGSDLPERFQWYTLRGFDSTLVSNANEVVFVYTHLPWAFFLSAIYPKNMKGFEEVKIERTGVTASQKFNIDIGGLGEFIIDRSKLGNSDKDCSAQILKSILKNPQRYFSSKSFELSLIESKRIRHKKLSNVPKAIIGLVEAIEGSLENPKLNSLEQKVMAYYQNLIANELTGLPTEKSNEIHMNIARVITVSSKTKLHFNYKFETTNLLCAFLICPVESKDKQVKLATELLNDIKKNKQSRDKRPIIIFSFNPYDRVLPYETLYYFD